MADHKLGCAEAAGCGGMYVLEILGSILPRLRRNKGCACAFAGGFPAGSLVSMYAWFMLSHTLEKLHVPLIKGMKFEVWIMYGMVVVLILNCILKNALKFGFGILM